MNDIKIMLYILAIGANLTQLRLIYDAYHGVIVHKSDIILVTVIALVAWTVILFT